MAVRIQVEFVSPDALHPNPRNARTHSKKQVKQIASSMERFDVLNPILALRAGTLICGHGRWLAAKLLRLELIPVVYIDHLSPEEVRAYALADNQLALKAGWNIELLAQELLELDEAGFTLDVTGFSLAERDQIIGQAQDASPTRRVQNEDRIVEPQTVPVTRPGDIWIMGGQRHRLLCGDALKADSYARLMAGETAAMVFTDPPFNCPIDGFVGGLGKVRHREFAMAVGEMSASEFTNFLTTGFSQMAAHSRDGAIFFACIDFRHIVEMIEGARKANLEYKQMCVWVKKNGGMGTFYRSRHECVCVFKWGSAPHMNNFGLGDTGRYRTNVWEYAGVNSFSRNRMQDLAAHPTVKSTAMVRDAILDVSERGDVVLDPFAGSGTTLIAAHGCGRSGYIMELDPLYCDVICRRFYQVTGEQPVRERDGLPFDETEALADSQKAA